MAGAKKDDKGGSTDLPLDVRTSDPAASAAPDEPAAPAAGSSPSAEERKARLNRAVANLTREARAEVRSKGEFEAVLVRGTPVHSRVHLRNLGIAAGVALVLALAFGGGLLGLLKVAAIPAAYAVFWLFLALTGGEELDLITVDDAGVVHSNKSGRDVETRGDIGRVAIPIVLIAVSGWITFGLIRDIVVPPQPVCNIAVKTRPDDCIALPNIGALIKASADVAGPSASPAASPAASASANPADATQVPTFSVSNWILLERIVRSMQLVVSTLLLCASIWFLHRMLTGRWVLTVRPVKHRLSDE